MEPENVAWDDNSATDRMDGLISELARKKRHEEGISDEQYEERMKALVEQGEKEDREEWIAYWGQPPEAGPVAPELGMSMDEWKQWKKTQVPPQANSEEQKS